MENTRTTNETNRGILKPSLAPGYSPDADQIEKMTAVRKMFDQIVTHYDLLNHLMSIGQDILWRKWTADRLPRPSERVLDIATGTGDLGLSIIRKYPDVQVIGLDFSEKMLQRAERKINAAGCGDRFTVQQGDALDLPFEDNSFDAATVAFGLRNITDRLKAVHEMKRVVRPGGKILVLEMTFPGNLGLRKFFTWYLNKAIPTAGGIISGNMQAYSYLPESIQQFLSPSEMMRLYREVELSHRIAWSMSFGITYLHEGIVPPEKTR